MRRLTQQRQLDESRQPALLTAATARIAATDRRHVFNLSAVASTPQFSGNGSARSRVGLAVLAHLSRFFRATTLSVTTSQDRALTTTPSQRVNQLMQDPYGDKSVGNYLNPAAFALPALGTLGNVGSGQHCRSRAPGSSISALSRTFQVRKGRSSNFERKRSMSRTPFRMNDPVTT